MTSYQSWIDTFIANLNGCVQGMCGYATAQMCLAFPELREARGYLVDARKGLTDADFKDENGRAMYPAGGPAHIWCVDPDGNVWDATANQFPIPAEHRQYVEHDDERHGILPTGKCPNCGFYRYGSGVCDDPECAADYAAWIDREVAEMSDRYRRYGVP